MPKVLPGKEALMYGMRARTAKLDRNIVVQVVGRESPQTPQVFILCTLSPQTAMQTRIQS